MTKYTHPNFKDVHWQVLRLKRYKPGYVNIKIQWWHNNGYMIMPQKLVITEKKWSEFYPIVNQRENEL